MGTRKSSQGTGARARAGRRTVTAPRAAKPATITSLAERATPPARRVLASAHATPPMSAHARPRRATAPQPPIALFPARAVAMVHQPTHQPTHQPKRQRFGDLRDALADGWEIVQPIFARPLWSAPDDSKTAFNFVLASAHGMRLVTVPEGRTVTRFIRVRQLAVDYARQ